MSDHNDREYYILRASVERKKADQIADPAISALHRAMADEYDKLIAQAEQVSSQSPADDSHPTVG